MERKRGREEERKEEFERKRGRGEEGEVLGIGKNGREGGKMKKSYDSKESAGNNIEKERGRRIGQKLVRDRGGNY